ncbi:hypothetical protein [Acetobacter thailandicus]|nr:hypothetical protein [Acetobacter thailandicus]MBS0959715.1 hypothetical protein [Acetobacter thailandicus]
MKIRWVFSAVALPGHVTVSQYAEAIQDAMGILTGSLGKDIILAVTD